MIPLARLYSPGDLGLFAIIQSVVTIGVTVAAGRFDVAVMLPKSDTTARVLQRLATRSIMLSSAMLSVLLLLASPLVAERYGEFKFAVWLASAGVATYFVAQIVNVQFWLNREQDYRAIAANRLAQSVAVAACQIGFAFALGGYEGLMAGLLVGQALTLLLVTLRTPELLKRLPADAPTKLEVARKYKRMPLIGLPTAVLDAVKTAGINILIANIAISALGQFSLAFQLTKAPVSLMNGAIAQVMLQRLSTAMPGDMSRILRAVLLRILLFSVPVFAVFYPTAPFLFPFLFGEQWSEAGKIAQALVPWLFMVALTSPVANVFVITNKQEWALAFAFISTAAAVCFLAFTRFDLLAAVSILSLIMASLLVIWIFMALLAARGFDASAEKEN
ncbi:oligosaccharide flippase family protein [Leucobacter sp. W1153]|uniref:oligosaccharide flippase family protein n=1 Tax=Leucobacter sp. W1153 TaxID=3439064 RepID=UPI003F37273B